MSRISNRGYVPSDLKEFSGAALLQLQSASKDLYYLLNKHYKIKGASTFIGNHYMFSERQRLAMVRTVSSYADLEVRKNDVDRLLETLHGVISSDAIILNKCQSWINLNRSILENKIPTSWCINLWEANQY